MAFPGITDAALESEVAAVQWQPLGQLQAALDFLRAEGVSEAVMAGKVSKTHLVTARGDLDPDARARALLESLPDLRDDSILRALADTLSEAGIRLGPQAELVPELLVPEGVLGRVAPTPEQWADIAFAWPIARQLGAVDVGQTVVVMDRAILAVEAIEGTDATIRRAGKLGRPGLCILKLAKPNQDPRFDLPAVGLETLVAAQEASAGVLAFEASQTVVFDRGELIGRADASNIAVVALGALGPSRETSTDA